MTARMKYPWGTKKVLNHFKDNFLISTISLYHTKMTEQIKSAKKIYVTDNGFLNLGIGRSANLGNILENEVFIMLSKIYDETSSMNGVEIIKFEDFVFGG